MTGVLGLGVLFGAGLIAVIAWAFPAGPASRTRSPSCTRR
jgi:hypothetical protein